MYNVDRHTATVASLCVRLPYAIAPSSLSRLRYSVSAAGTLDATSYCTVTSQAATREQQVTLQQGVASQVQQEQQHIPPVTVSPRNQITDLA
jgi:hypothetical protein